MKRIITAILSVSTGLLVGCVQIPQAAIDVNRQVSLGISTLGTNGQDVISAWEDTAFALLDEKWSVIYRKAEEELRKKRQIPVGASLTRDQLEDVAGLATLTRDESRRRISVKANEMRKVILGNAKTTLEANDSITQLLVSSNSVLSTQQAAIKQVGEQAKLSPDIVKFVSDLTKP